MKSQTMVMTCPGCDGCVKQVEVEEHALFRGVEVTYTATLHKCVECGLELAGMEEAAAMQEQLADAYRKIVGLLDSENIRMGLTADVKQMACSPCRDRGDACTGQ